MPRTKKAIKTSETPIFDRLKGTAQVRSMNNRWDSARTLADKRLAAAYGAPTTPPTAEQREAIAEQHGWI